MHHSKKNSGLLEEGGAPPLASLSQSCVSSSNNSNSNSNSNSKSNSSYSHSSHSRTSGSSTLPLPATAAMWQNTASSTILIQDDAVVSATGGPDQHLGLFSGISMIVGSIIGSGIFTTTGDALHHAGTPSMYLLLMALAGILSIFGGLCYVELGTAMPKSGGEHNYLLKSYGPYVAYVFDWTQSFLALPLGISYMAYMSALYLCSLFPSMSSLSHDKDVIVKPVACALIALITLVNIWSARMAAKLSDVLTVLKVLALVFIIGIGCYFLGKGHVSNFQGPLVDPSKTASDYGTALYFLLFSYGGWNSLNFMISELKRPASNLPLAIIISLIIVIFIYILTSVSYFAILPLDVLNNPDAAIGKEVGQHAFGAAGSYLISVMVILSCLGSTNSSIFFTSRLVSTAAEEGILYPTFLSVFSPVRKTPIAALILTSMLSMIYVIPSDPTLLIKMSSFAVWLFFLLTVLGLLILRFTHAGMHRPFKVWTPIAVVFTLVAGWLVIYPFIDMRGHDANSRDMWAILLTLVMILLPMPLIFFGLQKRAAAMEEEGGEAVIAQAQSTAGGGGGGIGHSGDGSVNNNADGGKALCCNIFWKKDHAVKTVGQE